MIILRIQSVSNLQVWDARVLFHVVVLQSSAHFNSGVVCSIHAETLDNGDQPKELDGRASGAYKYTCKICF